MTLGTGIAVAAVCIALAVVAAFQPEASLGLAFFAFLALAMWLA